MVVSGIAVVELAVHSRLDTTIVIDVYQYPIIIIHKDFHGFHIILRRLVEQRGSLFVR